jgi:uncharacterized short protein YbdD (DUF466 family)
MQTGYADRLKTFGKCVCDGARLMVGIPNYEAYLAHMGKTHPDQAPMDYDQFFRNRQSARFGEAGTGGFRCC